MDDTITVRYGQAFDLEIVSEDVTAEIVTLYVGKPGENPKIILPATFVVDQDGKSTVAYVHGENESTEIPIGKYKYQVTIQYTNGDEKKYPLEDECDSCDSGYVELPNFIVLEALDETEVVS